MKNYNAVLIKKTQKCQALTSGKIDNYKYLTDEKIIPSVLIQIIQQAKITYSLLAKAFEKTKTTEDQGYKQTK